MENEGSKTADSPASAGRRWVRFLFIISAILSVCVIALLLFLRSDTGMQKVVLPWISGKINGSVTAKTATVNFSGILHATDLRVKTFDKNGNVSVFAKMQTADIHLLRDLPELITPELDLEIIRWPQTSLEPGSSPAAGGQADAVFSDSFKVSAQRVNVAIPPLMFMEGRSPRFTFTQSTISCTEGMYEVATRGEISFSECPPAWHLLNQTLFKLSAKTSMTPQGLLWTGELILNNRFTSTPLPEFESMVLKNEFRLLRDGSGTMDLTLTGKELKLAELHATIRSMGRGKSIAVLLSGPALNVPTHLDDTRMKLDAWKSLFSVDWQTSENPFKSKGRVSFPGVSFSLPGAPYSYFPPLSLNGRWEAVTSDKGTAGWYASADLLKGEKPLLQLESASEGATPLVVTIPSCKLDELNLYAKPLGYNLPGGEVSGKVNISFDENQLYRGKLNLNVRKLEVGRGKNHERLTALIAVDGTLRPNESMTVNHALVKGSLSSDQGKERGKFTIKLLKGSPIFFDPRDRLDTPGKLILGITALLRGQDKDDQSDLTIKCRSGLNLTESPHIWFELLGNLRERTFLQGTINANLNKDWSLRYLEVSNANLQQISGPHTELLENLLGIEINSLSANAVIRENVKPDLPKYGFSSSLRYSGLRGLPWLPTQMSASQDLKVTGNIDFSNRKLDIAELKLQTQLSNISRTDKKITFNVDSKDSLKITWSPRAVIEQGNLNANAVIPSAYLPNATPKTALDDLNVSARLTASTVQDGRHLLAIAFSSKLAESPVLSFNVFSNFLEDGQLDSLDLNQVKLSIPRNLANSVGSGCPSVELAQCNAMFKNNRFSLSASATGLGNIPYLPDEYTSLAMLKTEGSFLGQHLSLNTFSFDCNGSSEKDGGRYSAMITLKEQGRVRLNGTWNPGFVSIPLDVSVSAVPELINRLSLFASPVSEPLKSRATVTLKGDADFFTTGLSGTVALGNAPVVDLNATVKQNRDFEFMAMDLTRCIVFNHDFSPGLMPIESGLEWKRVSAKGTVLSEGSEYQFDITASGSQIRSPNTHLILPFEIDLSTTGKWSSDSKVLQLTTLQLDGSSKTVEAMETAKFRLSSNNSLRFSLHQSLPILTKDSSGMIIAEGDVSPHWLAKALERPLPEANDRFSWQSSVQVTPAPHGNRAVFSLTGTTGTNQSVRLDGDLTHNQYGIPRSGTIKGTAGWSPVFSLLSKPLNFERWENIEFKLNTTEAPQNRSHMNLTWNVSGIRSFLGLPDNEQLQAVGALKALVSEDGSTITLNELMNTVDSKDGRSKLQLKMSEPWTLLPAAGKTAFLINSNVREDLILSMIDPNITSEDHRIAGDINLQFYPKGKRFNISCTGRLARDEEAFIDTNALISFSPSFHFTRAEISRLTVEDSRPVSRLIPGFKDFDIEKAEFKGVFARRSAGYDFSGALSLQSWRQESWHNVSVSNSILTFASHSKDGKTYKLTNVDYNGVLRAQIDNAQLATIALELAEPGRLGFSNGTAELTTKLQCSAIFNKLPGVQAEIPESALTSTLGIHLTKNGLRVEGDALLNDKSGEVFRFGTELESDTQFKLQRLKLTDTHVRHRSWLSKLVNAPEGGWTDAKLTIDWSRAAETGELKGPYTFNVGGLKDQFFDSHYSSRVVMKGVAAMKMGDRPRLSGTNMVWHGLDPVNRQAFAISFRQLGEAFDLPSDWTRFSPGAIAVTGAIYPDILMGSRTFSKTLEDPLRISGDLTIDADMIKGELQLAYKGDRFLDILTEYDVKGTFGGLTLKAKPVPKAVLDGMSYPNAFPEYKNAELKVSVRPGKEDSWMIYTTGSVNAFRDRGNRTRSGNIKLESHCEVTQSPDGQWAASNFPIQLRWNDDIAFKCTANAATDLSTVFSIRFNEGASPLPILFNIANVQTLSPGLACGGGTLQSSGNFTIKQGEWIANSRLLIKDALFEPLANFNRRTTSFDWDFMINSKGLTGDVAELKLTSKGPGWSNNATLDATWNTSAATLTYLRLESEGADFSPIWEIFRRNKSFPPAGPSTPLNLYTLLPSDPVLKRMRGNYTFNLKNIEVGPLQIDAMNARFNAGNGRLAIINFELDLNDSKIWAKGHLQSTDLGSNLTCTVNASKVPLRPILNMMYDGAPTDEARGELTFEMAMNGTGTSLSDALKSSSGQGKMSVEGFRFYRDDQLVDAAKKASIDDLEYLEFDRIASKLIFDKGKMVTSGFRMERDELIQTMTIIVDADGTVSIEDFEYRITLAHYDKYVTGVVANLFGIDPSPDSSPGYKVFKAPVKLVRGASGWGINIVDENLFTPFKESSLGKWLLPSKPPAKN